MKRMSPELLTLSSLRKQEEKRQIREAKIRHIAEDTGVHIYDVERRLRFIELMVSSVKALGLTAAFAALTFACNWLVLFNLFALVFLLEVAFVSIFLFINLIVYMADNIEVF